MERRPRPWHPFRHPGLCGIRGTLCVLFLIAMIVVISILFSLGGHKTNADQTDSTTLSPTHNRTKREVTFRDVFKERWVQDNTWFQLVNFTARTLTNSTCAVCMGTVLLVILLKPTPSTACP